MTETPSNKSTGRARHKTVVKHPEDDIAVAMIQRGVSMLIEKMKTAWAANSLMGLLAELISEITTFSSALNPNNEEQACMVDKMNEDLDRFIRRVVHGLDEVISMPLVSNSAVRPDLAAIYSFYACLSTIERLLTRYTREELEDMSDAEYHKALITSYLEQGVTPPDLGSMESINIWLRDLSETMEKLIDEKLQQYPELQKIIDPATLERIAPNKPTQLSSNLPQWTFPEVKAQAIAFADGPTLRHWEVLEGEVAMRHSRRKDSALQTKITMGPIVSWLGLPNTIDSLKDELQHTGIPFVLTLYVCIGAALEQPTVTITLDELIRAIGWIPRSTKQRKEMRSQIWRWLVIFDAAQVIGARPGKYRDPATRKVINLQSVDALIKITGRRLDIQQAFDQSVPPVEVSFTAGPWLDQHRGNKQILQYYGNIRQLAAIPAGKPSGAWAQAIGLTLQQWWREEAARAEIKLVEESKRDTIAFHPKTPLTRRYLLDTFPPIPTVFDILGGPNPKRAQSYWRDAITILEAQDRIGFYKEKGKLQNTRQGWADSWLDQPLDIRPPEEGIKVIKEISSEYKVFQRRGKKGQARGTTKTRQN